MTLQPQRGESVFHVVMIKPTHYDDEGYPIQWLKSAMPSNTLACLNGLAEDARQRNLLGEDVEIRLEAYDETNQHVRPQQIVRRIRKAGGRALITLVGVQSNQFPRAVDLARPFLAAGLPVCIGGFHVSGCIAMLPEMPAEMREAQGLGISFFAGEAEAGRLDEVLHDAWHGKLAPLYNYMDDLPPLESEPTPVLPPELVKRVDGWFSSMDLGRGCPYKCSFCTIINVQGHKSRFRSPDDLEKIVRANHAKDIHRFLITDDNFARNRNWEALFDRLILLRKRDGLGVELTIQVDTQCHRIPGFIEKAGEAGVKHVFIGLENINPDNLVAARKPQNKITDYRTLLQQWRSQGVITLCGYILGFPADTKESILRDIEIMKRELPLELVEFFILTPLPGSQDHKVMLQQGAWMDPDLNKYDVNHRVTHHARMTDAEFDDAWYAAWKAYYTPEHMRTMLRRAAANPRADMTLLARLILAFSMSVAIEDVHPLESGIFRLKFRRDRRHGMKRENPLIFYPRYLGETLVKLSQYWLANKRIRKVLDEIMEAPDRGSYSDIAITPSQENEFDALELFQATRGGEAAVARKRRDQSTRAAFARASQP